MFQEDLHVPPALTNPQIQTPTQSRASNLTLTEAACVTFSAITSWESQPIEPCYPVFGRLKKEAALPPAQVTPLTTDVSESYLRGFYRSPATRRICYLTDYSNPSCLLSLDPVLPDTFSFASNAIRVETLSRLTVSQSGK